MEFVIFFIIIFAVILVFAYRKAMKIFFNMALERETKYFRTRSGEYGPHRETILAGEEKLENWPCDRVTTTSFDGLTLHGRFYRQDGAARTMVLIHGWRGGWNYDFALGGPWLYEEGYNLLIVDQRAQGESEGAYMGMGILERKDCLAWLNWLAEHEDTHMPVYLMGVSMGASTVLMAAGEKLPDFVKGVIADCGFTTPYAMLYNYGHKAYHIPDFPLMRLFNRYCIKHAGVDLKGYSTLDAMKTVEVPVLFIHGKGDTFVPCEMTVENYNACTSPKRLLLVEGADHGMSFLADRETYVKTAAEFFAACEK